MSKPLTQVRTIREYNSGRSANDPVTAMYAPIGARLSPSPSTRWHSGVNRLV